MRLNEVAFNPPTFDILTRTKAIEFAKQHCLKTCQFMYDTQHYLYRTHNMAITVQQYAHVNGDMSGRRSKNTDNYYTLMMDNFPSWDNYPKRSKSFICTNDSPYRSNNHIFIPVDKTIIGRCPERDLWESFPKLEMYNIASLVEFSAFIQYLANALSNSDPPQEQWTAFKTCMERMSQQLAVLTPGEIENLDTPDESVLKFLQEVKKKWDNNLLNLFEYLMLPDSNGFDVGEFSDVLNVNNKEFWFSGEALIIPNDNQVDEFLGRVVSEDAGKKEATISLPANPILFETAYKAPTANSNTEKQAIEFARKNCLKTCHSMLETHGALYRGHWLEGDYIRLGANQSGRISSNTTNYYSLMMDNFSSWSKFPKRNQSFICTDEISIAKCYGFDTSVFIPVDGTRIGVCPDDDIWGSFPSLRAYGIDSLDALGDFINLLDGMLTGTEAHKKVPDIEWVLFEARMDKLSKMLKILSVKEVNALRFNSDFSSDADQENARKFLQTAKRDMDNDLLALFEKLMNPKSNHFEVGAFWDVFQYTSPDSQEMWFSGETLAVPPQVLKTFLQAVVNDNKQAEALFVQGKYLTEGYAYQPAGQYTGSGDPTGIPFDSTTIGKIVDVATDIIPEEFLLRANVSLGDRLKIRKNENEFEYLFNQQYNVLILYDSLTAQYQFYMAK